MSVADRRRQGGGNGSVESSLSNLAISKDASDSAGSRSKQPGAQPSSKKKEVADSWEDDDENSDSEPSTPTGPAPSGGSGGGGFLGVGSGGGSNAPPPTPSSPSFANPYALPAESPAATARDRRREEAETRPEKTTSTAARMIAGALGVRAPPKSEEMRQFEKAAMEKERAKREREKKEEEDREWRKRDVWE